MLRIPPPRSTRISSSAFTLVEVLVVVGILAVLMGILIPVVGKAKESSNRTACLTNLHQISMAFTALCESQGGNVPAGARGTTGVNEDWIWWQKAPVGPPATVPMAFS